MLICYNWRMKRMLKDSEERISELEDLYVKTRDQFLKEFENIKPTERAKIIQQLRGMLDDIAKEAGGRVKRQQIETSFGSRDSSFMELIAGIRGNLPQPKPVIDVMPVMAERVENGEEEAVTRGTGTETSAE